MVVHYSLEQGNVMFINNHTFLLLNLPLIVLVLGFITQILSTVPYK